MSVQYIYIYIPLNPTFIKINRFAGVYLIFLFLIQNIHCGYSLEPPRQGGSNVPTMYVLSENIIKIQTFSNEQMKKYK